MQVVVGSSPTERTNKFGGYMNRRNAFKSILALTMAPAIIKVEMLMPVKPVGTIIADDFMIEWSTKTIKHTGINENYYTVFDLYKHLTKLWDDDPVLAKTGRPFVAETSKTIKLKDSWNINDETAKHLQDGTIHQKGAIYTSIVSIPA